MIINNNNNPKRKQLFPLPLLALEAINFSALPFHPTLMDDTLSFHSAPTKLESEQNSWCFPLYWASQ